MRMTHPLRYPLLDDLIQPLECAGHDEEDIRRVDLEDFVLRWGYEHPSAMSSRLASSLSHSG